MLAEPPALVTSAHERYCL